MKGCYSQTGKNPILFGLRLWRRGLFDLTLKGCGKYLKGTT